MGSFNKADLHNAILANADLRMLEVSPLPVMGSNRNLEMLNDRSILSIWTLFRCRSVQEIARYPDTAFRNFARREAFRHSP